MKDHIIYLHELQYNDFHFGNDTKEKNRFLQQNYVRFKFPVPLRETIFFATHIASTCTTDTLPLPSVSLHGQTTAKSASGDGGKEMTYFGMFYFI